MKTLVYDTPDGNAEELVARIAVTHRRIQYMPDCSNFHAPDM